VHRNTAGKVGCDPFQRGDVDRFTLPDTRPHYESLLRTALHQNGTAGYEYILLDCPPSVAPLTTSALTAANLAIIPIQCEYYSLQALDAMFKTIHRVRATTNRA